MSSLQAPTTVGMYNPPEFFSSVRMWAFNPDGTPTAEFLSAGRLLTGRILSDLSLVQVSANLVAKSESSGVVLRVRDAGQRIRVYNNLLQLTRLHKEGVRLIPPLATSVAEDGGYIVTAWPAGDPEAATYEGLGSALSTLHNVGPVAGLATTEVSSRFHRRLRDLADDMPNSVVRELHRRAHSAQSLLQDLLEEPHTLLHGDPHAGNSVAFNGATHLIDLDSLQVGPREFDLLMSYVSSRRFQPSGTAWEEFQAGYGERFDEGRMRKYSVIRETTMNTWLATMWASNPAAQEELLHRLDTWDSDNHEPWSNP